MDEKLSIAPMMEMTCPHWRNLVRGITKKTVLYTEMVVDDTVNYSVDGTLDFLIGKNVEVSPSVIQLGGHNPETMAKAAIKCQEYGGGYDEINVNCGCPSTRVALHCFGAKLMFEPELVREIVYSMQRCVSVPISVKCRIGADDKDSYAELVDFVRAASAGGTRKIILHSRKCLLKGLTTKQNRDIPPLKYEVVHNLVRDFPELTFILNGGIQSFQSATSHLDTAGWNYERTNNVWSILTKPKTGCCDLATVLWKDIVMDMGEPDLVDTDNNIFSFPTVASSSGSVHVEGDNADTTVQTTTNTNSNNAGNTSDSNLHSPTKHFGSVLLPPVHGIMIGRAAFSNPFLLATADSTFYGCHDPCLTRRQVLYQYLDYCDWVQSDDGPKKKSTSTPVNAAYNSKMLSVTTSSLLRPVQNFMTGLKGNSVYRRSLNELYDLQVKREVGGGQGPDVRQIVSQHTS